jgi:type I restriction enzyme M protein
MNTQDIVQRLWRLCDILRDDGITYHQYVTELTYLLFLKMTKETEVEDQLPKGHRWGDLEKREGIEQLEFYRSMLLYLGNHGSNRVQEIYANASTTLKQPRSLKKLVDAIDELDWYSARHEGLGDLYEGLLEKNANEKKSGAGQYFTPRPLIDAIVAVMKPKAGEIIQDPAAGTCGFLIAADRYIKAQTDELFTLKRSQQDFQRTKAFCGVELVQDAHRLALMNMMLHGIDCDIMLGDTLSPTGETLPKADLIMTNPPFGTKKGGGLPTRDDFTFPTSNKQLAFLQHVYRALKPGGRAAVVLPDNVLFEENTGAQIRADLMDKCRLHTILRLPTGIFYAQGVKTNVLFFERGKTDKGQTKDVWFFDMRTNMPAFGKRTPFTREHFAEFEKAYGVDPGGGSKRKDEGEAGRWRVYTREAIRGRADNLDVTWLADAAAEGAEGPGEPADIARQLAALLQKAAAEIEALQKALPEATQ